MPRAHYADLQFDACDDWNSGGKMRLVHDAFDALALDPSNPDLLSDTERLCTIVLHSEERHSHRLSSRATFDDAQILSVVNKCLKLDVLDTLARALVHACPESALLVLTDLKRLLPAMGFSKLRTW